MIFILYRIKFIITELYIARRGFVCKGEGQNENVNVSKLVFPKLWSADP
jgi:hypothetical protein